VSLAAPPAPWLLVVQRSQVDLFRHLTARFADVRFVEVILDRRLGDRRRITAPIAAERRQRERRRAPPAGEREHWALFGYRLVRPEPVALSRPIRDAR
jgi:hypothetical protein